MVAAVSTGALVVVYLIVLVFEAAALWNLFTKAGRPGWTSIVPIYNAYVLLKIAGRSGWWLLAYFIPIVDLVPIILLVAGLARNFGKGKGFAVGLLFLSPVFLPVLGFGSATYVASTA
jgi:hypothetical protein